MIDVIALSDLHGELIALPPFDLLLIGGDTCPVWNHGCNFQRAWLNEDFSKWVNDLPFKDKESRVVMIAGNHDLFMEEMTKKDKEEWISKINDGRLIYLDNEEYTFNCRGESLKIFGTPYCKMFGNWAFMKENLDKYYEPIPEGLDILLSHDAADLDGLGEIKEGHYSGINAGNVILAKYVLSKKPKYYFCGHIHSGRHELKEVEGVKTANVSIMNESYYPVHDFLKLSI